jgi:hypothetical protein
MWYEDVIMIATIAKIKINDVVELREKLDQIYGEKAQIDLAMWALQLSKYIFSLVEYDYPNDIDAVKKIRAWQIRTMQQVGINGL